MTPVELMQSVGIGAGAAAGLGLASWLFRRPRRGPRSPSEPALLALTPHDPLTLHQLHEGCLILGGTGSGKTTGPMDHILLNALRAGCGAVWLCVKPQEPERALRLARAAGRAADIVLFKPGSGHRLNVLHEELTATGGSVEAAVAMLDAVVQVAARGQAGGGDDAFWRHLQLKVADFVVRTVFLARGTCGLLDCYALLSSAPQTEAQVLDATWRERSFCARCLLEAKTRHPDSEDVALCADWWLNEWVNLAEKTRSIAFTQLTNLLKKFIHEPLRGMLTGSSTISPDDPQHGAIIICAMPVLEWRELGVFFNVLVKTAVQRATLRRDTRVSPRPVLLVQDEAQWFILPEVDAMAQTVSRQSRLISVAATQTIPGLIAALGGTEKARHEAEAWIGLHQTKLLCANACKQTNEFFSQLIGQHRTFFASGSTSTGPVDLVGEWLGTERPHAHAGFSEQLAPELLPSEFLTLRKGGRANNFLVEFFAFQGGRVWSNGRTFLRCAIRQLV